MHETQLQGLAVKAGLDWDTVKQGLIRLLPIIETVARLTPNKLDDSAVLFLKALLESQSAPA